MIYFSINKPHFLLSHKDFFLKSWQPSPKNMAKNSNRTFPKRKGGIVENEVQIFLLTATTGEKREAKTGEYMRHKEVKLLINDDFCI
jgi:hypothetical protein